MQRNEKIKVFIDDVIPDGIYKTLKNEISDILKNFSVLNQKNTYINITFWV